MRQKLNLKKSSWINIDYYKAKLRLPCDLWVEVAILFSNSLLSMAL